MHGMVRNRYFKLFFTASDLTKTIHGGTGSSWLIYGTFHSGHRLILTTQASPIQRDTESPWMVLATLATGPWSLLSIEVKSMVDLRAHMTSVLPLYWLICSPAALREGIPITTPEFFASEEKLPDSEIERIFRSDTKEQIPLLKERIRILREAGRVLVEVKNFEQILDQKKIVEWITKINLISDVSSPVEIQW